MKRIVSDKVNHQNRSIYYSETLIILAVSLSLFGGRWISYIGFPDYNLYLIDLLYYFGLLGLVLFQKKIFNAKKTFFITSLLAFFVFFQLFRNLNYSFVTRLRDLAPYIYLLTTAIIINKFPVSAWIRAIRSLRYAIILGAIWTDLVMIGLLKEFNAPQQFSGVPIFSARWDHSGISMCIGLLLWGSFPSAKLKENIYVRFFLLTSVLLQYSRASYVGLFFVLCSIFFFTMFRRKNYSHREKRFVKVFVIFIMIGFPTLTLVAPIVPQNSALSRIGINNFFSPATLIQETRESGTANARIEAQKLLKDWLFSNELEILGAGPGREMVLESNAYQYLSGARDVRSPHSWFYGNFGRFGYLGLIIWHSICFLYVRVQNNRFRFFDFPVNLIIVIYVISLFGVVMESPFGILPFSFFLGGGKLMELSNEE